MLVSFFPSLSYLPSTRRIELTSRSSFFAEFDSADEEVFELDEDEDDLIDVDEDAPFVSAFPPEEDEGEGADEVEELPADGKRKRTNAEDRRERKKKRKQFSGAFGTYEDFQKLIEDGGPDDNI